MTQSTWEELAGTIILALVAPKGARIIPEKDIEESIPTPVFDKGTLLWRGQNHCVIKKEINTRRQNRLLNEIIF